jgi:dGTPase
VDDLAAVPLLANIIREIDRQYPALDDARRGAELVRELISYLIQAVMTETGARLAAAQPASPEAVRHHGEALVAFTPEAAEAETMIKIFLRERMYRHPRVMLVMRDAEQVVRDLFDRYCASPGDLPKDWLPAAGEESDADFARRVGNFIAGMTDRYALIEHTRLFDSTPDLR